MDAQRVGERLRALRKLRGVTQHQLAARTHFSVSLVKKVEQGSLPSSSAFVAAAAQVLAVKPGYLYGTDQRDVDDEPRVDPGIAELRTALDSYDDPSPEGDALSLSAAKGRLAGLTRKIYTQRSTDSGHSLAHLIHHLYVLAERPGRPGEEARAVLHDAYRMAGSVAARFRQFDLAAIASERHIQLAPLTGDPLRIAVSAYHRSTRHLQNGDFRMGIRALGRAREYVDTTAAGRAMSAQLDLRSAVLAARAGDAQEADEFIGSARAVVTEFAPPATPYVNIDSSLTNIAVHWCAVPVENYDGTEAVRRAGSVHVADPERPERVAHHHIDMARAWLLHGDREHVLENLNAARRILPEETRRHPAVRETVLSLAEADRRTTDSLAGFARWAGIAL